MAYGVKYQFSIESTNGDEVDIFLLQRDYSGQKHIRALGRAPILKRERNGCILGTSLEIFAECRVDGEFAELYTSDAYEYKVEVYKRQILQWTGFVSPELYAEPDIAPPYDVQIIATDGLGELKNYDFAAYDRLKSYQAYIESMLEHTGLALAVDVVSDLQYYDEGWSDANGLESIVVDLSHKAGENCYDVLQAMLTSVNACITQQDGSWTIIRESDLYSWRGTVGSVEFGSMNSCDWWPVGNLNADVIPAKKYLSLTSENHYKLTVLQNSSMASDEGWTKEYNAAYDETEKAYILPDGGSNIRQTANFVTEVDYRLFLHISARNVGDGAESQKLGVMIKIDGRMYQAGDEFWLKELADYEGRYAWSNTEGYLEFELPGPSDSETRADASDIEVVIPLYKYDSRSYAYATSLEVTIFNISGIHDIYVYKCFLQQYEQSLGHKVEAVIANDARESMADIELALNDGTYAQPAADIFRNAIPIAYNSEAIIQKWMTPAVGEGTYLSVMAKDYAMQVALPRMRYRGKLNIPSQAVPVIPLLFSRDDTYYFLNTYSCDLLNDELEVELVSIPNASITIESEVITEMQPGSSSGESSSSGGSGSGGGYVKIGIGGLTDVALTTLSGGQSLVWDDVKNAWVNKKVSGGGGDAALEAAVTAEVAVGYIKKSYTLPEGMTFTEFVQMMFSQAIKKTLPSVTLGGVPTEAIEVGSEVTLSLSATYKDGYFTNTDEGMTQAGCEPGNPAYVLDGSAITIPHTFTASTAMMHSVAVTQPYGASTAEVKNSAGDVVDESISAGSDTDTASFIVGYRAFWGYMTDDEAESLTSDLVRGLEHSDTIIDPTKEKITLLQGDDTVPAGQDLMIAIPSSYILSEVVNKDDTNFAEGFALSYLTVQCAGDTEASYKVYRYDNQSAYPMDITKITIEEA